MSNKINIEVNTELAEEAAFVLSRLGLDLEDATKLFFRRCILEQRLPFDVNSAPTQSAPSAQESKGATSGGKITQTMVENVWEAFKKYQSEGGELRSIADEVSRSSGMTAGSAFIYLVILENLFEGQRNTRNMKMRDLEFFMERIRADYGINIYENALSSLEESLPYWESQPLGNFAEKVRAYLDNHNQISKSTSKRSSVRANREQLVHDFNAYLFSTTSPFTGKPYSDSTVNSYVSAIETVCAEEGCTWEEITPQIGTLVIRYDQGGDKSEIGEKGHNTVINALRAYQRFANSLE